MTCNKCSKPLVKRVTKNPSILHIKKWNYSTDDFKTQMSEGNGQQNDTYDLKGIVMIPFDTLNYAGEW